MSDDEPCMCGTPFTCMADEHDYAVVRMQRKVNEMVEDMAHGARRVRVASHEHVDGSGEGYCSCGAERCSLPSCDMGCVHKGGWVEREELLGLRRPSVQRYMDLLSGWWYMRPGETMDEHAARLKADPRWQESDQ